jgi:hypothetical protein
MSTAVICANRGQSSKDADLYAQFLRRLRREIPPARSGSATGRRPGAPAHPHPGSPRGGSAPPCRCRSSRSQGFAAVVMGSHSSIGHRARTPELSDPSSVRYSGGKQSRKARPCRFHPRPSRRPMCRFPAIDHDQPTAQQIHAAMKSAILSMRSRPAPGCRRPRPARGSAPAAPRARGDDVAEGRGADRNLPSQGNFVTFLSERWTSAARNSSARRWKSPPASGSATPACAGG